MKKKVSGSTPGVGAVSDLRREAEARLRQRKSGDEGPRSKVETERTLHELRVHQIELEMQNEELLRVQVELEALRARYFDLYELAPVSYCTISDQGLILETNLTFATLLGKARGVLAMSLFSRFIVKEDCDSYYLFFKRLVETGKPQSCELRMVKEDGTLFWAHLDATVVTDLATGLAAPAAGVSVCRVVVSDINDRKRMEEVQTFLARTSGKIGEGSFFRDLAQYLARCLRMDFVCIDRLKGDGLHAETVAVWCDGHFEDNVSYALKDTPCGDVVGKEVCSFPASVCQFFPRDQVLRDLRAESYAGVTLWSHDGRPIGLIAVIGRTPLKDRAPVEATLKLVGIRAAGELERQDAEALLLASEDRFKNAFQYCPIGMALVSPDGRWLKVNASVCAILGYSEDELMARTFQDITHPDDLAADLAYVRQMLSGEISTYRMEKRYLRKDGRTVWALLAVSLIRDRKGVPLLFISQVEDITERRWAEGQRQRLSMAIDQVVESVIITDPEGVIQYVNPAFEKITGYSRAEALGQTPRILKSGKHDEAFYQKMWQTLNRRETWSAHVINKKKDGTLYEEESTISPVLGGEGKVINYVAVKRDMTHEVAVQRQLLQAQKLEAVGRLAGGVAHDFNNLLMVIGGYAGLLLKRLSEEHPGRNMVDEIRQAVKRGASLTQQLLALGSKQMVQVQSIQLNAIVEESGAMLKQLMSENVRVIRNCASDLVPVMGDSNQLGQVLMNLILNARDAMPKGGTLTVETSNLAAPAAMSFGFEEVPEGRYAMLSVRDTGMGMSLEVQTHIFEPFYTTKEKGKGTGFGLPIVYGIIKRFGGHLAVQSQVGEGSTFRILLPEARQAPPLAKAPSSGERMGAGTETLLLVEDEEALRRVTTEMLRSEGYHVIHASEAREALLALNNASISIDLMLSDVVMPGMQGTDLAMEALRLRPEMKVILMSGYSEHKVLDQVLLQKEIAFLAKPIPEEQLLRKLREVLDARDEGTRGSEK